MFKNGDFLNNFIIFHLFEQKFIENESFFQGRKGRGPAWAGPSSPGRPDPLAGRGPARPFIFFLLRAGPGPALAGPRSPWAGPGRAAFSKGRPGAGPRPNKTPKNNNFLKIFPLKMSNFFTFMI